MPNIPLDTKVLTLKDTRAVNITGVKCIVIGPNNKCTHDHCIIIGRDMETTGDYQLLVGGLEWSRHKTMSQEEYEHLSNTLKRIMGFGHWRC